MNEKYQKVFKFNCENCNYYCDVKSNYKKHLITKKHIEKSKNNILNTSTIKYQKASEHKCENCNKVYKSRNGLWYHKRKCITENKNDVNDNNNNNNKNENLVLKLIAQNQELMNLLTNQNEETKELHETIRHQSVTIQEIIPKIGNNNNNITNNNNNKFNMNVFLSEDCKDAINFSDFIKRIQVSVEDLENQTQLGYVNGIAKLFIDNIKELGINKRPIHCTDKKRNTLYIKENDEWSKEGSQECVVKGIEDITRKTYGRLIKLKAENPVEYSDGDSAFSNKCLVIQKNLIPTHPRETSFVKIVGHISDKTTIEENQRKLV
jgi:hypothetical protein